MCLQSRENETRLERISLNRFFFLSVLSSYPQYPVRHSSPNAIVNPRVVDVVHRVRGGHGAAPRGSWYPPLAVGMRPCHLCHMTVVGYLPQIMAIHPGDVHFSHKNNTMLLDYHTHRLVFIEMLLVNKSRIMFKGTHGDTRSRNRH